jgi:hypothetical protein
MCVGYDKNVWTVIIQALNILSHYGRPKSLVHVSLPPHVYININIQRQQKNNMSVVEPRSVKLFKASN